MSYRISNKNCKQALAKGWFADAESIKLCFNTDITSLPNNTKVSGNLDLRYCTSLTSLPNNLSVGGYLDLRYCTSLTSLPDNLRMGGDLDLYGCTSLTSLPDNLRMGGDLDLYGCTSLTTLPNDLKVKGEILLENTPFTNGFVKKADRVWFTLNKEKVVGMKTKQGNIFNDSYTEYLIEFDTDADEAEFVMTQGSKC